MKSEELFDNEGICAECGHSTDAHDDPTPGNDGIERIFCHICPGRRTRMIGDEGSDYPQPYFMEATQMLISPCWISRQKRNVTNYLPHSPGSQSDNSFEFKGAAWTTEQFDRLKPGDEVDTKGFKYHLYFEQKGRCKGCQRRQSFDIIEIDHVLPRSRGGEDTAGNLQLLCPTCNGIKGNRSMEYLKTELRRRGTLKD